MVSEIFLAVELRDCSSASLSAVFSRLVPFVSDTTVRASNLPRGADKTSAVSIRICLTDLALGL